jgi:hypothetical protein
MPDITLCDNSECPLSKDCWMYNCPPSEYRQSYATFEPIQEGDKVSCEYFIHVKK